MQSKIEARRKDYSLQLLFAYLLIFLTLTVTPFFIWKEVLPFVLPAKEVKLWGEKYKLNELYPVLDSYEMQIKDAEISDERKKVYLKDLEKLKKDVETSYPFPTLDKLLDERYYPGARLYAFLFFFAIVLIYALSLLAFIFYDKKRLKPFFKRVPIVEPSLKLGDTEAKFLDWGYLGVNEEYVKNEIFKGEKEYKEIIGVIDERIPKPTASDRGVVRIYSKQDYQKIQEGDVYLDFLKLNKDIKTILQKLESYGKRLGLLKDGEEEKFRAIFSFVLFHKVLTYFGGLPSGFVNSKAKDYTFKRIISCYENGKIPNISFFGKKKEKEEQPARFLKILHGFRLEKFDIFEYLKDRYNQIPDIDFVLPE